MSTRASPMSARSFGPVCNPKSARAISTTAGSISMTVLVDPGRVAAMYRGSVKAPPPMCRTEIRFAVEGTAEHVLEGHEPIITFGQQGADRGVGEVRELNLHGSSAAGEGLLDLLEVGGARHAAESEARNLVER